ncbi:hypothetical protein ACVMB2_006004 [Sinorhizobium meliloti]
MYIRPAVDKAAIVWHQGWHDAHAELVPPEVLPYRTQSHFLIWLAEAPGTFYVARSGENPLGFVSLRGFDVVKLYVVNAAVNFPKSAEVKFPNYADGVVMERWLFFGGRPLGFGGGVKAGGVISAFERTCSGMSSAC